MRTLALAVALLSATALSACQTGAQTASVSPTSAHIVAALKDPARPQDADATAGCLDRAKPCTGVKLDEYRKPAEMLALAGVTPGMKVGELIPGAGYFTRLFSKAVGPTGKVYVFGAAAAAGRPLGVQPILDDKANYANVSYTVSDFNTLEAPEKLDLVWTSQNYHDMHNASSKTKIDQANKAVFDALKPGGVYVVLDHQSAKGTEFSENLHRIDKEKVKAEVLAAGFQLVEDSNLLVNPADDGTKMVFDNSVRRHTNQFILKFRKPA